MSDLENDAERSVSSSPPSVDLGVRSFEIERPSSFLPFQGQGVSPVPPEALTEIGHFKYNKELVQLSRLNRQTPTLAENTLWEKVLSKKQTGFKFRRQKPIDNFILDFYCSELLLCVEVDGEYHEKAKEQDEARTERLNILGIIVIRYTNQQVLEQIEEVKTNLINKISNRIKSFKVPSQGVGGSK
jgi:very-short-patch-repair endonuclease